MFIQKHKMKNTVNAFFWLRLLCSTGWSWSSSPPTSLFIFLFAALWFRSTSRAFLRLPGGSFSIWHFCLLRLVHSQLGIMLLKKMSMVAMTQMMTMKWRWHLSWRYHWRWLWRAFCRREAVSERPSRFTRLLSPRLGLPTTCTKVSLYLSLTLYLYLYESLSL